MRESTEVKIISDGTVAGTRLVNKASGKAIINVKKIKWEISTDSNLAVAEVTFVNVPVKIDANIDIETGGQDE